MTDENIRVLKMPPGKAPEAVTIPQHHGGYAIPPFYHSFIGNIRNLLL